MAKANISARVEPMEGGKVVYLPMGPITSKQGAKARGRLQLRIDLTNNELLKNVTVEAVRITMPGTSIQQDRVVNVTLPKGPDVMGSATRLWVLPTPGDHVVFDLPAPAKVKLAFKCTGFSERTEFTYDLAAHKSPGPNGTYLFPAKAVDLLPGEFWSVNGCTHGAGNEGSQLFAYDMGVTGKDHVDGGWSDLLPGKDRKKNANVRCWGKPLYAMADGVVLEAVNNCPGNPVPLEWTDQADLNQKMADQQTNFWGSVTPNGGAGNHLYIQHGDEVVLYAHLQEGSIPGHLLKAKAKVKAGEKVGLVGNSGNSSGPHVHIHAIQGTAPEVGPLRPIVLRDVWAIDNDLIQTGKPDGFWSRLDRHGIPEGDFDEWWKQDVFLWPSAVPPPWPEAIRLSVPEGEYQKTFDSLTARGLHPVWFDAYELELVGVRSTWFNVVFRPMQWAGGYVHASRMSGDEYDDQFDILVQKGDLNLVHVESYWSGRDKRVNYAAIFAPGPKLSGSAYHGVGLQTHETNYADLVDKKGLAPTHISVVSVNGKRQFTARYEAKDVGKVEAEWTMTLDQYQKKVNTTPLSLVYVNFYRHEGKVNVVGIWHEKAAGYGAQHHLDKDEFDKLTKTTRRDGLLLRCVAGYQRGNVPNYAAVWAKPPA